ncbi:MAG TPA: HAD-IC family P-type ATPase, partial [Pseudonocardiaceae bacterium]|nr:HAD-IC family P-type ATPase [Pseudonocardiaceae bacterium]
LHASVEAILGRPAGKAALVLGGAVSNALGSGPLALVTTAGQRLCLHREATARQQAWERFDNAVAETPGAHRATPVDTQPRPVPIPPGAVERVADRSAVLALAGYVATLAATRSADRALGVLLAGIPRAATAGRDAFAAQLGHDLCTDGSVVLDPEVLRRLDRVDTVVLDAPVLLTGQRTVDDVLILDEEIDGAELVTQIHDLVDPEHPGAADSDAGWAVRPVAELTGRLPEPVHRAARERAGRGTVVLVVLHRSRPVGLVTVRAELHPLAEALVAAARTAGTVLVAGTGSGLDRRLEVDGTIAGGTRLPGSVRRLQADGHVVAVLSPRSGAALAAADVGIGLLDTARPPWGAHLLCEERAAAWVLLRAVSAARVTSKRSALLSGAGSAVGATLAALGPATGAPARASFPVHVAALLALVDGTWSGRRPARQPAPVAEDRTPWHALSVPAALSRLGSSPDGLAEQEAARRARPAEDDDEGIGLVQAAAEELANPLTPALAAGAGISASVGSAVDALMITGVLGVNALIGGAQRLGAERALRALGNDSAALVRLRREGVHSTVRAAELVPGDIIELQSGDAVPADCRLVEAANLEVDESSLTGESEAAQKSVAATAAQALGDRRCMLYQGTVVAAGRAMGLVVATGERTEVERAARAPGIKPPSTGVAGRLRSLAKATLPVSAGSGVVLLAADLLRGRPLNHALTRAVSLAVAAVPEGLPFVATMAELAAARRLSGRGALVRNPSTIEALGRVDILCFDKTGTLTEGRIKLRQVSDGRSTRAGEGLTPDLRRVVAAAVRASPWDEDVAHQTDRAVLAGAKALGVAHDEALIDIEHVDELVFEPSRG